MPSITKKPGTKRTKQAVIAEHVDSYANDPFFVKKAADAKQTIVKYGLPKPKQE